MASARDALDYLDRFDRPLKISEQDWPDAKRKQQATAWFVIGRALVNEALQQPASANRTSLIEQAIAALDHACTLKPGDMEIIYLLGVAHLSANDSSNAAIEFATVYRHNTELAPQAREQLAAIYEAAKPKAQTTFEDFVSSLQNRSAPALPSPPAESQISANKLPAYAGSESMRTMPRGHFSSVGAERHVENAAPLSRAKYYRRLREKERVLRRRRYRLPQWQGSNHTS